MMVFLPTRKKSSPCSKLKTQKLRGAVGTCALRSFLGSIYQACASANLLLFVTVDDQVELPCFRVNHKTVDLQ